MVVVVGVVMMVMVRMMDWRNGKRRHDQGFVFILGLIACAMEVVRVVVTGKRSNIPIQKSFRCAIVVEFRITQRGIAAVFG